MSPTSAGQGVTPSDKGVKEPKCPHTLGAAPKPFTSTVTHQRGSIKWIGVAYRNSLAGEACNWYWKMKLPMDTTVGSFFVVIRRRSACEYLCRKCINELMLYKNTTDSERMFQNYQNYPLLNFEF